MPPEDEEIIETPAAVEESTGVTDDKGADDKADEGSALDAVSAAIDAETPKPADEADSEVEPKEGDAPKPAEAAKPPEGAPPEEKPAAPVVPPPAADPINDPIDATVKGKTRERMTQLISTVKEAAAERDRYLSERDEIVGMIQATRSTPEQYGQALDYLRAVNSGDPAQIRIAIKTAQQELHALASMIGEPVPGVDMLTAHADLQAAVQAGDLNPEHAQEIAAARALRSVQQAQGQRATEYSQGQKAIQAAVDDGKAALNQLEAQLQADPQYGAKRALLTATLRPVMGKLEPQKWAGAFNTVYGLLGTLPQNQWPDAVRAFAAAYGVTVQLPAPSAPVRAAVPHNQPLRARQPAGNSAKQASSMLDAINEGIERARR